MKREKLIQATSQIKYNKNRIGPIKKKELAKIRAKVIICSPIKLRGLFA